MIPKFSRQASSKFKEHYNPLSLIDYLLIYIQLKKRGNYSSDALVSTPILSNKSFHAKTALFNLFLIR